MAQFYVHMITYDKEKYIDVIDQIKLINEGVLSAGDSPKETVIFNLFGTMFQKITKKEINRILAKEFRIDMFDVDALLGDHSTYNADKHTQVSLLHKGKDFNLTNTLAICKNTEVYFYTLLTDIESDRNMYNIRAKLPTFKYIGRVYTFLNAVNAYQQTGTILLDS